MKDFVPGNQLQLLCTGEEYFPALLEQIAQAKHEIRMETYIFEADTIGHRVANALCAAAKRGVKVHLLVDGFGAAKLDHGLAPEMRQCGVEIQIYRPEVGRAQWRNPFRRHRLRRLHRKLSVFDSRIAFIGGINIVDDSETQKIAPRFDYAVQVEGPVVADIHAAMTHVWQIVAWAALGMYRHTTPAPAMSDLMPEAAAAVPVVAGNVAAALVIRDNMRHRRDIELAYLHALQNAQREVLIANAYFLPGTLFRRALANASRRGVKVTLLLQGQIEYPLLHYATQALYARLMRVGIRIVEYRHSFLHAKVAVIDGHWATVGSSNIDPFSLLLSREANLVIDDVAFATELQSSLNAAMETGSVEILPRHLHARSWLARTASQLAYGIVRMVIGFTGYGRRRRR
ncbi:MAG: cardiolipin synthase ClsB [Rhodocyclaceae bacterium]|nr:cardiolipin synthase ClsB [Rhodocyclaceae bacterium]MBP6110247.1 cardiolipin synthase ClsB [Rhodocyclaceae bacterium]MBP6279344.1 cardiolipin synthase ClsB [Rhodocyclaceae bacterium]